MKNLLILVIFACACFYVQSHPVLDNFETDKSLDDIKDELLKILRSLEIEIPDDIAFRVKYFYSASKFFGWLCNILPDAECNFGSNLLRWRL